MPNPSRNIPRGPGSIDPEFTSQVAVQQAGPVAVEQETPFQRLERSLTTIAGLGAQALQGAANLQSNLNRLKDQAVARQERIMADVRRSQVARASSMQQRRLQDVQSRQMELLSRAEQHDPEWLFRQARVGFNNAASVQEQAMWSEMLVGSKKLVDDFRETQEQEAENKVVQEFAMAGFTAKKAVTEMVSNLQASPELQRELMGDGVGIHQRVQDWVLAEATQAAPEIFDIRQNDPNREMKEEQRDELVAQLVEQSLRVGDGLVKQHTRVMEGAAFQTGTDLLGAHFVSYFEGKLGIEEMTASIGEVGRLHFNHLPQAEQQQKFKAFIADAVEAAVSGQFGQDVGDIEERVTALIETGPFNALEKINLGEFASERLSRLSVSNFNTLALEAQVGRTVEVPVMGEQGTLSMRSVQDPNAAAAMAVPDPVTGRTEYDQIADRAVLDAGLDMPVEDMRPSQVAALAKIRSAASKLNADGQRTMAKSVQKQDNLRRVFTGDASANPSDAWEVGLVRRAFTQSETMAPNQIRAVQELDASLRAVRRQQADGRVTEPESRQVWDGANPLERNPQTRTMREAVWMLEAEAWNGQEVMGAHGLPDNMLGDIKRQWVGGDPEAMMDVVFFASALNPKRLDEVMSSIGSTSSEAFALRNAVHNYKLAANNIEFRLPVEDLMDRARQTMEAEDPFKFLDRPTPFADFAGQQNRTVASQAFAEIIAMSSQTTAQGVGNFLLPGTPFANPASEHRERMSELQAAFFGPSSDIVDRMFGLWAVRVQTTDDDPATAANYVWQQMKDQGFRFTNVGGRATIVQDFIGHFGEDDPRAGAVEDKINEWSSTPLPAWQRDVIQRALGIQPFETPLTMTELYAADPETVNPAFVLDDRGEAISLRFGISDGTNRDAQFTLRKTPFDYGGVIVQPVAADGRVLPLIRAKHDVEYTGPDGETYILRAGEPLSVFSDHIWSAAVAEMERLERERNPFTPGTGFDTSNLGLGQQVSPPGQPTRFQ